MGSGDIYKTIEPENYTFNTFKAYKTWTLTESTIEQYSSSVNEAQYVSASVVTDPYGANSSGIGKRGLFSSIWQLYYQYPTSPYQALGGNAQFQDRDLSSRAVVVEIDNNYIGERIKPGSITITDNSTGSILIVDDGLGNLINSSDTTVYVPSSSLAGYWSFNEGFITDGNRTLAYENRNHNYGFPSALAYDVNYTAGIYGSRINFYGTSGSFAVVDNYRQINFRTNEDFAVSVWVWIPESQSMTSVPDNMIVEKWDCIGGYPFVIRMFNQTWPVATDIGKVYCATWDTINGVGLTSTAQLTGSVPHHIVYQKKQGMYYEMWVDGVLNGNATASLGQTHNDSPLYIGARGYANAPSGTIYQFTGGVDELRIYSGSLTNAQINTLYTKPTNTNIIGNAFYAHGVLVLTNLSGSYNALMLSGSEFVMNYKSTVTITENTVLATVTPNEFNMTFNPSATTVNDVNDMDFLPIVSSSEWSPYITTIGFYDDKLNLLAVGKFAKPIKKPTDMPITFAVRWDS